MHSATRAIMAARNYGGAVVPRKREVGARARSARVHEWNMAVQPPRARCASVRRGPPAWRAPRKYLGGVHKKLKKMRYITEENEREAERGA
jgi:hypothetical protein